MPRPLNALVGLTLLLTSSQSVALAQEPPARPADFSLTFGTRLWATTGTAAETISFPVGGSSRLRWRGTHSIIPEVFADAVWKRLVVRGALGRGDILDGDFIDEDFNFETRWSVTESAVEGDDVLYANADAGVRILRWVSRNGRLGYMDVLGGYQYWREQYEAFGATGAQDPTLGPNLVPIVPIPSHVKVITHDFAWQNVRVGGRWEVPFPGNFGFRAEIFFIPWSKFELTDIHPLRSDRRKDPSSLATATGGFGYEFEGALSYAIWRGLTMEGGFRYWKVKAGDGVSEAYQVDGTTLRRTLEGADTERYGLFVGLHYRF